MTATCQCGCGAEVASRFKRGHQNRKSPVDHLPEDRGYESECWIWQGSITPAGYGSAYRPKTDDAPGKKMRAHRLYYENAYGPIPDGLVIDHLCGVKACVNPEHLDAVGQPENVRRGAGTRLTADQAADIKARRTEPVKKLMAEFGLSKSQVVDIRAGRRWGDVEPRSPLPCGQQVTPSRESQNPIPKGSE